jgi:hypothetical protein
VFPSFFEAQAKGSARKLSNWWKSTRPTLGTKATAAEPTDLLNDDNLLAAALHDIVASSDTVRAGNLAGDLTKVLVDERDAKRAAGARKMSAKNRGTFGDGTFKSLVASLLRDAAQRANNHSSPWAVDEPDDFHSVATNTLADSQANVAVLIAGHSHLARAMEFPGGYYLNTGTWADLMSIPRNLDALAFGAYASSLLDLLREPEKAPWSLRPFRRLTWVDVAITDDPVRPWRATLCEWPAGAPRVVHQFP